MSARLTRVLPALAAAAALVGALVWWSAAGQAQALAPSRIGYVDLQRVLARSQAGAAARDQLEKERGTMQKQVDGTRNEIQKLQEELEKKGQLLSPESRREKQETLERKVRDARRLMDDLQKELQKKEQELTVKVLNDISGVVAQVGKERGFTMVVEKRGAAVIWGAPEADITDDIIKAANNSAPAAPAAAPKQPGKP
jgi:outer membrane protein